MEERAKDACLRLGYNKGEWHDTWLEALQEEGGEKVFIRDRTIYEIQDTELDSYGFAEATKNEDGSINYFISWYNGGGSMHEVLEAAIDDEWKDNQ
jgi:hypothetical protein